MRLLLPLICFVAILTKAYAGDHPASTNGPSDPRKQLEQDVFLLVNKYRQAHDLAALQWDDTVAQAARNHSRDMASGKIDFGHDGFEDRIARLRSALTGLHGAGENVLRTNDPEQVAQRAVDSWLKSPHHLENIRGDYNYTGLGIWQDDQGMVYFTQIFVQLTPAVQTAAQTTQAPEPAAPIPHLGALNLPLATHPAR